ncbi:TonB-dependent receptor, partial [bacterium]|nr:TonB-dependent receptor [bacterium]
VTKSGGNEFHGVFRLKYMTSDWKEDYEHPLAGTTEFDYWEPTVTFEGPIIRDKLWFMVSYNYSNLEGTKKVLGFYGADYSNPDELVSINADREFLLPYAKLTFQPNQDHKFVVNYSGEEATLNNRTGDELTDTPEVFNSQEQGGPFYSFEWTWLTSPNLYFIARVGSTFGILDNVPFTKTGTDHRDASFYDTFEAQTYNNSPSWSEEERNRFQLSFTASYFVDEMMGQHEFKTGMEYHDFEHVEFNQKPGGASYIITQNPVGDPDNPDSYFGDDATREMFINPGSAESSGEYYSFYIQDDWAITDSITLNLGLRYELAEYFNNDGDTDMPAWTWGNFAASEFKNPDGSYKETAPMKFDDMLAPRIGFNWDVFGNGKTALHAFYGRFYNPFDLSLPGLMFQPFSADNTATRNQQYTGPQWTDMDKDGIPDEDFFFDDANWETTSEAEEGDWNLIDPNLESEYTDEIAIGIEHEIMENFSLGVAYTHRETNDMVEDTGIFVDEDGNIVWTYLGGVKDDFSGLDPNKKFDPRDDGSDFAKHLYYITNAEGNVREYDGLEINARARRDSWDLQASYTIAKAEGSVIENQEGGGSGVAQFSGQYDTYQTTDNLFGELPWSCRHYVKIAGSYHFDVTDFYEMSFGVNAFWRSGYHYSKRMKPADTYDPDDPANDINDPSTWTGRPPYRMWSWSFPEGRGGYELPSFYTIDISWQNTIKFGRFGAATLIFDIENITDHQAIIAEAEDFNPRKPDLFGNATHWSGPRDYRVSLKYSF